MDIILWVVMNKILLKSVIIAPKIWEKFGIIGGKTTHFDAYFMIEVVLKKYKDNF